MAVVSKDELIAKLKEKFGDDSGDDVISIMEDVADTYDSFSDSDSEDWKAKYEENDAAWRKRYIDRFSGKEETEDVDEGETEYQEEDEDEAKSFDDLFEEERED